MGIFSGGKKKNAVGLTASQMLTGGPVKEQKQIQNALREQQQVQLNAIAQERAAVNKVAEHERQMLSHISAMTAQLNDSNGEVDRAHKAEEDLRRALRLASERIAAAQASENNLRAELEESKARLLDAQMEVAHLQARLFGEKGVRIESTFGPGNAAKAAAAAKAAYGAGALSLGAHGPPAAAGKGVHEDDVIQGVLKGAVAAPRDAQSVAEEKAAASRHARETIKRLLHFVKKSLAEDLELTKSTNPETNQQEVAARIAKSRALAIKLESALMELLNTRGAGHRMRLAAAQLAAQRMGSMGAMDMDGGVGFTLRVAGGSLPRSVAVNDSSIRPFLLTSGPAVRWVLRAFDAPPDTPRTASAKAEARRRALEAGDDEYAEELEWTAGETLMMAIEAVDETGVVDSDFDGVVLVAADEHVHGRGLVRITKGVGQVPLLTTKSGEATVSLQDGGFSTMERAPPLRVTFRGGPPAQIALVPEQAEATAGDGVVITIEARDRFDNISTEVTAEVLLHASHGATWGDEPVKLEAGVTSITLMCEVAATVALRAKEVLGAPEISDHGLANEGLVRFIPGAAACVQLSMPGVDRYLAISAPELARSPDAIVGVRTKLLVTVADQFGNTVPASQLASDLTVVGGGVGNAQVERGGHCSIADGKGEVWVTSETAVRPTAFHLQAKDGGGTIGGLSIRHTEDEPFEAWWTAGGIAQFGLYLPEVEEPARVGGGKMVIGVRTEDSFGNPVGGFDGRVMVILHDKHVRFCNSAGKVLLTNGEGRVEVESELAEPFLCSLQDIARTGLRTASVLRTAFKAQPGVRAVFGDVAGAGPQPVGLPYPLPLYVLDKLGNVDDDFEGEVPVSMSGGCRVAGKAPELFRVVGGRANLAVLTTIAETVTFTLGEESMLDVEAALASPFLQHHPTQVAVHFVATETQRLALHAAVVEPGAPPAGAPATLAGGVVTGGGPAGGGGANNSLGAGAADVTDAGGGTGGTDAANATTVVAGGEVVVTIKAIDAYNNLVLSQDCTVLLEADLTPVSDDAHLSTTLAEPPRQYLLTLSNGRATQKVPTRMAGELSLTLKDPTLTNVDISSQARLKVVAAPAVSLDVVNMPEAGKAGVEFAMQVRALDQFGNVDETFDRVVTLDSEGAPPGMELANGGSVQLAKGIGRCSAKVPHG